VKRLKLKGGAELRPLTEADVHELWALIEANREHLRPWMPWAADQTPERTLAFVRQAVRQEIANDGFQAALRVDGRIAGVAGYHGVDRQNATTTLG
jgi:ribosomal-protein-serine acetyltransferase